MLKPIPNQKTCMLVEETGVATPNFGHLGRDKEGVRLLQAQLNHLSFYMAFMVGNHQRFFLRSIVN